jgi:hypothetical protein
MFDWRRNQCLLIALAALGHLGLENRLHCHFEQTLVSNPLPAQQGVNDDLSKHVVE